MGILRLRGWSNATAAPSALPLRASLLAPRRPALVSCTACPAGKGEGLLRGIRTPTRRIPGTVGRSS
eukprot:7335445-Alexandrium_andersonii.AAC.1